MIDITNFASHKLAFSLGFKYFDDLYLLPAAQVTLPVFEWAVMQGLLTSRDSGNVNARLTLPY
jgi:hypothetical protein